MFRQSLGRGFVPQGFERYDTWVIQARGPTRASLDLAPICALRAAATARTRWKTGLPGQGLAEQRLVEQRPVEQRPVEERLAEEGLLKRRARHQNNDLPHRKWMTFAHAHHYPGR